LCFLGGDTANPQKENGYTAIANEILDNLIRWHLSSYEWRVVLFTLRKTYGFQKKDDWISLSQFVEATGISRPHVCRALKMLAKQNIITKRGTTSQPRYSFQKDYSSWEPLPKGARVHSVSLPKGARAERGNEVVPKGAHTKETITKEISTNVDTGTPEAIEYGDPQINRIYREFEELITPIIIKKKDARKKIKILINSLKGVENASKMIRMAAAANLDRYGPKCGSVEDLLEKQGKITVWARSQVFEKIKERSKHVTIRP
jgi:phage replication O-like protein O